ncbi:MAG: prepilin-type N-terminal cleavage/methylation domain-containing protein [Candidatus Omnitrophica bacterium]|nr:prepilin-type N-terminal cleavage/methylation domain-containing protein [Candidatus Omnitrophota bacterium]
MPKQNNTIWTKISCLAGFTMFELMLVVVILSVLAALAVPNFRKTQSSVVLQKTAEDLRQNMRYAQILAMSRTEQTRLVFSKDLSDYQLLEPSSAPQTHHPRVDSQYFDENGKLISELAQHWNDDQNEMAFAPVKGRMGQLFHIPEGIQVTMDPSFINFFPDGRPDKMMIRVCQAEQCYEISTQKQRGYISLEQKGTVNGVEAQ